MPCSASFPWPAMRRVEVPGPGGPIETWIVSPADAADEPLPAVVNIHGGPLGAWSPAPSLENVLLASRGYRVILPNIRGGAGYGKAWITPQLGDFGGVDADDVLAAVDHVVGLGLADPARLGILGLSYGGFMANWLIGAAPDRFAAAVSEVNPLSHPRWETITWDAPVRGDSVTRRRASSSATPRSWRR